MEEGETSDRSSEQISFLSSKKWRDNWDGFVGRLFDVNESGQMVFKKRKLEVQSIDISEHDKFYTIGSMVTVPWSIFEIIVNETGKLDSYHPDTPTSSCISAIFLPHSEDIQTERIKKPQGLEQQKTR
ncbi:hypothetical protein Dsin_026146 [Dipteronia sinensis]|uniref:Uncharacterized protein n=1 Tax=Dipteronia sinensis TaxID=43782 RepID=A0AAE0DXU1_9ROSI|nr:hypothetical protein Dsin_026146 [Dipteronia sinensis]